MKLYILQCDEKELVGKMICAGEVQSIPEYREWLSEVGEADKYYYLVALRSGPDKVRYKREIVRGEHEPC
jgi:hypothetical protein